MPNEQTTVPLFVASEVLTAADMNLSAGTGVPVFSNTTTRDAGFGGAGEKVLAEGQLCYLSSTNVVQYYDGAAWATVGPSAAGLTLVKAETAFTAQTSFNVANVFSTTYTNYLINIRNTGSASGGLKFQLSSSGVATASGYSYQRLVVFGTSLVGGRVANTTAANLQEGGGAFFSQAVVNVFAPFSGQMTYTSTNSLSDAGYFTPDVEIFSGNQQTAVANQDGFTLLSVSGTITGTYTVYGYAKS